MKGIKDWFFSHLVSKILMSSMPSSGSESLSDGELLGSFENNTSPPPAASSPLPNNAQEDQRHPSLQRDPVDDSNNLHQISNYKKLDQLGKIEDLQIKFLRILQHFGQSQDNPMVAKVLYRLHLATLICAGESDLDRAKAIASEQEAALGYSCKILVLGKTGVGKSATINSIFDQTKTATDPFGPATDRVQEISGTANGINITFIDTPGFLPASSCNIRKNRKIMLSVKKFIKRSPPDVVLYIERLDMIDTGSTDYPLLKLLTEILGPGIWFNTILVMTHSSSALPEGPNGYPVSYESYVTQCTDLVQRDIHQAISDTRLENPIVLVENHSRCQTNVIGQRVLPNGLAWKSQFLLTCICTKVLDDASTILKLGNSMKLGRSSGTRLPSLPHLLSSFLQRRPLSCTRGKNDEVDECMVSDTDGEDEYDQLPPIRILTKSQFDKLTPSQKHDYLDELEYRETLYTRKQLKEESRRRRRDKLLKEGGSSSEDQEVSPEAFLLPDMAVPPSFDSDNPIHRYRCLVTGEQWLVRPVLNPHGWDHDIGFDGINLESAMEMDSNLRASVSGQMSKDKQDFSIHSESAAAYTDPRGPDFSVGFDVQSADKDLICTFHTSSGMRNLKHNLTECWFSLLSFRNKCYVGAKVEDTVSIRKNVKLVAGVGRMGGDGQAAYGGSLEAVLRGRDYPVRDDRASLTMTVLSFDGEVVLGGGFQSEFRPIRGLKMSVNAGLNSRMMGQVSVKTVATERVEIALIAVLSVIRGLLLRRKRRDRPERK